MDFLGLDGEVQDVAFAVGEPFLEHLITTEFIVPDNGGDVTPESAVVQIHVKSGFAERGYVVAHRCLFVRCVSALHDNFNACIKSRSTGL